MVFYDRTGDAVAYTDDGTHIFLFSGMPAAYIYGDCVYTFSGRQLGWLENGWIRDLNGKPALFTENAGYGGPVRPVRGIVPVKGAKRVIPVKCVRDVRRVKPVDRLEWSPLSGEDFFERF